MSYKVPTSSSQTEIEIKKSRFIGYAKTVLSRDEATKFVAELKDQYPDARHVCWGYLIGDPNNSTNSGCNDDGEPSGTAGKPILAQINYSNIGNVVVAVVRYFGGIRLGAGGLVRAYREAAQTTLLALKTEEFIPQEKTIIEAPFNEENTIRQLITNIDGELINSEYSSKVTITALIPNTRIPEFELSLGSMTASIKKLS